jgi:hypothetical protein
VQKELLEDSKAAQKQVEPNLIHKSNTQIKYENQHITVMSDDADDKVYDELLTALTLP